MIQTIDSIISGEFIAVMRDVFFARILNMYSEYAVIIKYKIN